MSKPSKVDEMFNNAKHHFSKLPPFKSNISLLGNESLLVEPMTDIGVVHKGERILSLDECKRLRGLREIRMEDKKKHNDKGL